MANFFVFILKIPKYNKKKFHEALGLLDRSLEGAKWLSILRVLKK